MRRPATRETEAVRACYAGWSRTYYKDYYGPAAAYPPVHERLVRALLKESRATTVLDAGCGPASMLRHLARTGLGVYGFDVTPTMVAEARRVLAPQGIPADRIWRGSVLVPSSFTPPNDRRRKFDAAVCVGVLPHVPATADIRVIENLKRSVTRNGLVVVGARNQLFALFTLNRYSHEFMLDELIQVERLKKRAGHARTTIETAARQLRRRFRMDLPAARTGKAGVPGYDEVLSRTHNPFVMKEQFTALGFRDVRVLFHHYHCMPPMFERDFPELFRKASLHLEDPTGWRGHFMASAFVIAGRRG